MTDVLLRTHKLCKRVKDGRRDVTLLHDIDLQVERGAFVALCGPSGSGKTTLLHVLGALDPHFAGEVWVAGTALRPLSDRARTKLRGTTLGFVFQSYHLLGHLNVLDNVRLPSFFTRSVVPTTHAMALLEQVGLAAIAQQTVRSLSGGERQRVAIARALLLSPQVLLCDEPTGNLDAQTADGILDLFGALHAAGHTLVMVTHDERLAKRAQHVLHLRHGRLQNETGET